MAVVHEVHRNLTESLVEIRNCPEKAVYRMADRLLERDKFNREFIGIEASGDRAIFYDRLMRSIKALPFEEDGFNGWDIRRIQGVEKGTEPDDFVQRKDDWGWLHPRYGWLVD